MGFAAMGWAVLNLKGRSQTVQVDSVSHVAN